MMCANAASMALGETKPPAHTGVGAPARQRRQQAVGPAGADFQQRQFHHGAAQRGDARRQRRGCAAGRVITTVSPGLAM
jgi:hypothetical protein